MGGSPPDGETQKMFTIVRLLGLRTRRPRAFLGAYEPLDAGSGACAFLRGGDVVVVAAVRTATEGVLRGAPDGRWRDVFSGEERSFGSREPLTGLVGERGASVFERL